MNFYHPPPPLLTIGSALVYYMSAPSKLSEATMITPTQIWPALAITPQHAATLSPLHKSQMCPILFNWSCANTKFLPEMLACPPSKNKPPFNAVLIPIRLVQDTDDD